MGTRIELSERLHEITSNVYFQPPATKDISYPCIIYGLNRDDLLHADDKAYKIWKRYSVTIIDRDPDSLLPSKFSDAFGVGIERHYTSDNLHHFSFTIVY